MSNVTVTVPSLSERVRVNLRPGLGGCSSCQALRDSVSPFTNTSPSHREVTRTAPARLTGTVTGSIARGPAHCSGSKSFGHGRTVTHWDHDDSRASVMVGRGHGDCPLSLECVIIEDNLLVTKTRRNHIEQRLDRSRWPGGLCGRPSK